MEVELIFKIAAIGIIVAVLNQLLIRSGREEQAHRGADDDNKRDRRPVPGHQDHLPAMNMEGLFELCMLVMLKAVGLTVLGELAARLCKDAGENAMAYAVELGVRAAVLGAAMPLLSKLFEFLGDIMSL